MLVEGRYLVEVRLNGYNNPTGKCYDQGSCGDSFFDSITCCSYACCDIFDLEGILDPDACIGSQLCDSYFTYCLRPFGEHEIKSGCSTSKMKTTLSVNTNDGLLDFSQSTVLDLSNPQNLSGLGDAYNVKESSTNNYQL